MKKFEIKFYNITAISSGFTLLVFYKNENGNISVFTKDVYSVCYDNITFIEFKENVKSEIYFEGSCNADGFVKVILNQN